MIITLLGLIVVAAFPLVAAFLVYSLVSGMEMVGLALALAYTAGVIFYCDVAKHSRKEWKEAITTRDGRIILGLGAVTLLATIAMMIAAHFQLL